MNRIGLACFGLWLGAAWATTAAAAELEFAAHHESLTRAGRGCGGTLRFEEAQVRWTPAKATRGCRAEAWPYGEMQRLVMEQRRIAITGYADRRWRLGADERWTFRLMSAAGPELYALLRAKMDGRFAPRYAEAMASPEWSLPAKMLSGAFPSGNWGGEGTLEVGADRVVFRSAKRGYARTWLDAQIDNVSAEPPFGLTLEVREGGAAVMRTFQLKQELNAERFDALWRRLNRPRGLKLLTDLEEKNK